MNKKDIKAIILCAILLIGFSVITLLIPFQRTSVFWIAYIFGMISIILFSFAYYRAFSGETPKSKFYGVPTAKVGVICLAVQLTASIIFMALSAVIPVWLTIVICAVILIAAVMGTVAAEEIKDRVVQIENTTKKNTAAMLDMRHKTALIADLCEDAETKELLKKMAEDFKYSDPVSSDALKEIEQDLGKQIDGLQEAVRTGNSEVIKDSVKRIKSTLAERNRLCALYK